jgi:hypothetical protein
MPENKKLKNFMWEYSDEFQSSLQYFSKRVFKYLNKNLKPEVLLLAVLDEENKNKEKLLIEPGNWDYDIKYFKNIINLTEKLKKANQKDTGGVYSVDIDLDFQIKEEKARFIQFKYESYVSAILRVLKKNNNKKYFCDFPVEVNGYLVFIILGLDKNTFESYYSLTKTESVHKIFKLSTSLLESIANEFINTSVKSLREYRENSNDLQENDILEILFRAAKNFMYIGTTNENIGFIQSLFEIINTISSLRYEGKEGLGKLIITKQNHNKIKLNFELEEPIFLPEFRKVRKFLEISNDENFLVTDGSKVYGLGAISPGYNPKNENLFIINFTNHYQWELVHDNRVLMKVAYREPQLPDGKIDQKKFSSDFKRIFKTATEKNIKNLWNLILEATNQKHGTMLVISDNAQKEAERLKNQSFKMIPKKIEESLIPLITSIDGSVLLDNHGICFAIGVILDGMATEKGTSARGARYNSALKYYDSVWDKFNCLIVVISEDGMIDIIPELMPKIRHLDISLKLKAFENFKKMEKADRVKYEEMIDWFLKNTFYLTQKECDYIKKLQKEIEKKNPDFNKWCLKSLKPDPQMDDSYFLD